jgi:hypothetical protein
MMLLTEAQSARAVGGVSVALGTAVAVAPTRFGKLLGADIRTGQDRYLGRQIGLDLASLGAVLLTAAEAERYGPLLNVVVSATALASVTVAAIAKKDIPRGYGIRMLVASGVIGAMGALPLASKALGTPMATKLTGGAR